MSRSTPSPTGDTEEEFVEPHAEVAARKREEATRKLDSLFNVVQRQQLSSGLFKLRQHAFKEKMHDVTRAQAREASLEAARAEASQRFDSIRLDKMRGPFDAIKQDYLEVSFEKRRSRFIRRACESHSTNGCVNVEEPQLQAQLSDRFNAWLGDPSNLSAIDGTLRAAIDHYKGSVPSLGGYPLRSRGRAAEIDGMMDAKVRSTLGTAGIITGLLNKDDWKPDGHSGGVGSASFNTVLMTKLLEQFAQDLSRQLQLGAMANVDGAAFQVASSVLMTDLIKQSELLRGLYLKSPLTTVMHNSVPAESKATEDSDTLAASAKAHFDSHAPEIAVRLKQWVLDPRNHLTVSSVMSECYGIYKTRPFAAGTRLPTMERNYELSRSLDKSPALWPGIMMSEGSWTKTGHLYVGGYDSFNTLVMGNLLQAYLRDLAYDLAAGVKPGTGHHNLADLQLWLTCAKHPLEFQAVAHSVFDNAGFVMISPEDYAPAETKDGSTQLDDGQLDQEVGVSFRLG
ncbi:MAG: hypothetical protein P1U34_02755 [Coxiellaceae bacterium]|nr:hypothetical protein [Coxiellaceae bacterium]